MSDQKPVKRDAAWLAKAQGLAESWVSAKEALTWGLCSSIEVQLALAEFSAHLTAPDPRDAELALCRDLLRSAAVFLTRFARLQAVSGVNSPELRDLIASIKQTVGDTK